MPRKKLNQLNQVHGKIEKPQFTTLDQIWGDTGVARYNTLEASQYESQLKEMQKTDLHAHAVEVGVIPVDDRDILVKRLMKEFNRHVSGYNKPTALSKQSEINKKSVDQKILNILSEGR
jgi:hypothetical protein